MLLCPFTFFAIRTRRRKEMAKWLSEPEITVTFSEEVSVTIWLIEVSEQF
jgi:hypothetical protein